MSVICKMGAPDYFHEFAWDLLKDSGATGHFPTSLQHKNMQSNKHVLIHTSKFKNTSVVLVSFIMWMTKCTRVDTVSELMSPHRKGGRGTQEEGSVGGKKKAVHFPNLWPLPPAVWPEYTANRGMLQLGLLAVNPCFRGPETFEMMEQLLTRRHFKGFQKFCR